MPFEKKFTALEIAQATGYSERSVRQWFNRRGIGFQRGGVGVPEILLYLEDAKRGPQSFDKDRAEELAHILQCCGWTPGPTEKQED